MTRLRGLKDLVHDTIEHTTKLVEETHEAVAKKPVDVLTAIEPIADLARTVDDVRKLIAGAVFGSIHAVNRGVQKLEQASSELVARPVIPDVGSPSGSQSLRSIGELGMHAAADLLDEQQKRELTLWADMAQGVLNGLVGDFLAKRENGLAIELDFRVEGQSLELTQQALRATFPEATGKLCIFVHGLACSEDAWLLGSERWQGAPGVSYATLLGKDLGFTSLYVRYNSGRHVSENGRELAQHIARLLAAYPVPVEQLVLIGHSMGGLVARSAAHYGALEQQAWVQKLSHVVCLGSPHQGAPLEQFGNALTSVLGKVDTAATQVISKVLNARSVGIKDLRFGSVVDEDWFEKDPDAFLRDQRAAVPFVDSVVYAFVASTLHKMPGHPVNEILGDILVRLPSASGEHRDPQRRVQFHAGSVLPGLHHVALMNHAQVYAELKRILVGPTTSA
jgi:pimeloyl-ACP methyl ester carboxylesterase